jgi:hypothetical protein
VITKQAPKGDFFFTAQPQKMLRAIGQFFAKDAHFLGSADLKTIHCPSFVYPVDAPQVPLITAFLCSKQACQIAVMGMSNAGAFFYSIA